MMIAGALWTYVLFYAENGVPVGTSHKRLHLDPNSGISPKWRVGGHACTGGEMPAVVKTSQV